MIIQIDNREKDLISLFEKNNYNESIHKIEQKQLQIGDVILKNNEEKEQIIIERKSLYDLASSIKDGRYKEQSFRLNNCSVPNHNIIYLIEGDWENYDANKGRMNKDTLLSACITLNHYKGFTIWQTRNTYDTVIFITQLANKVEKMNRSEKPFYETSEITNTKEYIDVACVNREKKKNIDENNIGVFMLACIPGVSTKTASRIIEHFGSIKKLINSIEKDSTCLNNLTLLSPNGKERKINKKIISDIIQYLKC
jgi:ERCC4-type nuclease